MQQRSPSRGSVRSPLTSIHFYPLCPSTLELNNRFGIIGPTMSYHLYFLSCARPQSPLPHKYYFALPFFLTQILLLPSSSHNLPLSFIHPSELESQAQNTINHSRHEGPYTPFKPQSCCGNCLPLRPAQRRYETRDVCFVWNPLLEIQKLSLNGSHLDHFALKLLG